MSAETQPAITQDLALGRAQARHLVFHIDARNRSQAFGDLKGQTPGGAGQSVCLEFRQGGKGSGQIPS